MPKFSFCKCKVRIAALYVFKIIITLPRGNAFKFKVSIAHTPSYASLTRGYPRLCVVPLFFVVFKKNTIFAVSNIVSLKFWVKKKMTNFCFRLKNLAIIVACFAVKRVIIAIAIFFSFQAAAQDVITLRNGVEMQVNIVGETDKLIRYTRIGDERATTLAVSKRDVVMIVYQNGNRVEFDALTISTISQKGDFAIGITGLANLYGVLPCVGIGPKIYYNVSGNFRLAAEFDFSNASILGVTLGIRDFSVYAYGMRPYKNKNGKERLGTFSLGLGALSIKVKDISGETNDSDYESINLFVFSVGYGIEYPIAPNLSFNCGVRMKLSGGLTGSGVGMSFNLPVGFTYMF